MNQLICLKSLTEYGATLALLREWTDSVISSQYQNLI